VAALYVKNVPERFMRVLRSTAALQGLSMRAYVLRAVKRQLERDKVEIPVTDTELGIDRAEDDD
jgi:hypothetical protein